MAVLVVPMLLMALGCHASNGVWDPGAGVYTLTTDDYELTIQSRGFLFGFTMLDVDGVARRTINPHALAGMQLGGSFSPVDEIRGVTQDDDGNDVLRVRSADNQFADVTIYTADNTVRFKVEHDTPGSQVTMLTGELGPTYGLADPAGTRSSTNLKGVDIRDMGNNGHVNRFICPFVVFPQDRFAGAVFFPGKTSVGNASGRFFMRSRGGLGSQVSEVNFYYFTGSMPEIYLAFKAAREEQGYPGVPPKARFFELGWETWDWLRFNTSAAQVQSALTRFINQRGYPLRWAVTGSGFWDEGPGFANRHSTTSFGVFHRAKYPDPEAFIQWMHDRDIHWLIGLRTNFVRRADRARYVKGPFSNEAETNNFFLRNDDGSLYLGYSTVFPKTGNMGLLDGNNSAAVDWFGKKYNLWMADGVKEDAMIYGGGFDPLPRFDIYNGPMHKLAVDADADDPGDGNGEMVMARNGMYSSPGTLMRINDSNIGQMWNRIPINWLQNAAVGAPNAYADTVNFGQFNSNRTGSIRYGWMCAMTAGLTFSPPPDNSWSPGELEALDALVWFHHAIGPYMYSAAVESHETGYPYTMTPLPIAFPDDAGAYDLANTTDQQYQWMIGESVLAAPLMHSNYQNTDQMDIYLPPGTWINYTTGAVYQGPTTLNNFTMNKQDVPAFIGGKGIIVQRSADEKTITCQVYPNAPSGSTFRLHDMDGVHTSMITANHRGWDTDRMRVTDLTTGQTVPFTVHPATGAVQFEVDQGHDYRLETLRRSSREGRRRSHFAESCAVGESPIRQSLSKEN